MKTTIAIIFGITIVAFFEHSLARSSPKKERSKKASENQSVNTIDSIMF